MKGAACSYIISRFTKFLKDQTSAFRITTGPWTTYANSEEYTGDHLKYPYCCANLEQIKVISVTKFS
jgi:hypothetical protein